MNQIKHKAPTYFINPMHPITITLIGCGGNGSQVLTQLARINHALIKLGHAGLHVTCFDNDIITEANLSRQLFSESELGMNKAVALITRINRFFGTSWKAMPVLYTKNTDHYERLANITISCVDTIKARKEINSAVKVKYGKSDPTLKPFYWMDLGNTQNTGQFIIGTLTNSLTKLPTVFEAFPSMKKQKDKQSGPSCSLAEALDKQDLFINSTLVQLAMGLLWKLFREGEISYHGAFINLNTLKVAPIYI